MNTALPVFLSMSLSGGALTLALLAGKRWLGRRVSRQWQYYIWLVVILRLLLPFGVELSWTPQPYQAVEQVISHAAAEPQKAVLPERGAPSAAGRPRPAYRIFIGLVWLAVALGLLLRKVTAYQSFLRYLKAGWVPVSDTKRLDLLAAAAEQAGVKRPVELCVHPLISSPLLTGFFHPCIVLPVREIPKDDFFYTVLHELTHYKRRDLCYQWLTQAAVCLHWFNPLAHWMGREVNRAREFSCDEAVLAQIGRSNAPAYGKTLLNAMAAAGTFQTFPGGVALSENKQFLKERLEAIMGYQKQTIVLRLLTGALTLCIAAAAALAGVSPAAAADPLSFGKAPAPCAKEEKELPAADRVQSRTQGGADASQAARYYEAGSLPLFQIAFSRLDEPAQRSWLERIYADGDFAFFSAAVQGLDAGAPLLTEFAERAYGEEELAFFSTLTDCMDKAALERWLDRALNDGSWAVQSILFNKLDRDNEWDKREEQQKKEWERAQAAEYQAAGITMDGKNYYYQGQLVQIFLDIRGGESFYTLDWNPAGSVNIRVLRNADDKITGVAYMTDTEAAKLLEDMRAS